MSIQIFKCTFYARIWKELREVNSFNYLPEFNLKLELDTLDTESQVKIVSDIQEKLREIEYYIWRFDKILEKNPDFLFVKTYNMGKCKDTEKVFLYVSPTTVSVEWTFSKYKDLLTDKRRNFKFDNIEKHLFIYFNTK